MQQKVTKWKENQTWRFTKTLRSIMKEKTWKKTPLENFQEDFQEVFHEIRSSGELYFRGLPRRIPISIPESDPDLKNMYIQKISNDFKKKKK